MLAMGFAPDEVVHRPDPGLARGVWEASGPSFYVALAVVLAFASLYLAYRLGFLKRRPRP